MAGGVSLLVVAEEGDCGAAEELLSGGCVEHDEFSVLIVHDPNIAKNVADKLLYLWSI